MTRDNAYRVLYVEIFVDNSLQGLSRNHGNSVITIMPESNGFDHEVTGGAFVARNCASATDPAQCTAIQSLHMVSHS
jgi:hypothetical protein